jgi:RNA polymerase sigma-70 factor (ECF subfamily)
MKRLDTASGSGGRGFFARAEEDLDPATLRACRKGDRAALTAVFRAHAPRLEAVLRRVVGPSGDVEDLLQQTFAEAIGAFPRFRGDARVGTWLCSIAIHTAQRWLRNPGRRRAVALELVHEGALADRAVRPDDAADRRRLVARVYEALDGIAPKKRIAFILHALEDRPLDEVAVLMGATRMATKSRVYWARRELVRRVEKDPLLRELLSAKERER